MGKNMPMVSISDLEIEPRSKDLIVATHGRGIYKINIKPIYDRLYNPDIKFFEVPTAYLPNRVDTHRDYLRRTYSKVPITFWSDKIEKVELQVMNEKDSLIWTTTINASKGFNQYRWDLITEKAESDSPYFIHYNQFIDSGMYKIRLRISEGVLEEELEVRSFLH